MASAASVSSPPASSHIDEFVSTLASPVPKSQFLKIGAQINHLAFLAVQIPASQLQHPALMLILQGAEADFGPGPRATPGVSSGSSRSSRQ